MQKSSQLKLSRAEHHIADVESRIAAWQHDGYRILEKRHADGYFELCAEMLKDIHEEIPVVIGDAFHCLRDCLDHLIFELAQLNGPLSEEQERRLMFPIPRTSVVLPNDKRIIDVSDPYKTAILGLLPDPGGNQFNTHPLVVLDKMNNRDKHRCITLAAVTSGVRSFGLVQSSRDDIFCILGPATPKLGESAVPFCRYTKGINHEAKISVLTNIVFDLGCECAGKGVSPVLRRIHDHIRDVVIKALV